MAGRGGTYPAVFVVDSQAGLPPLPPKTGLQQARRRAGPAQTVLFLLVALALCGVVLEACFIYRLYTTQHSSNQEGLRTDARKGDPQKNGSMVGPKTRPRTVLKPSKPLAHLTAGVERPDKYGVMHWQSLEPEVHDMEYRKGELLIKQEGYYYVYAKLCFSLDNDLFHYAVMKNTSRYLGPSIELLRYRTYQLKPTKKESMGNGYLGGVFHLIRGDSVFVQVKGSSSLRLQYAADNFFGMFML
ncbi:tumor necrosis factor ligand superfamily member 14 [Electrophorus electricus]|uniref:THD domain-containing protein n=1 Tax=Electrophorus electricus TaxID=8005 RepID=A0A4W4ERM4_ELEEL|nr:tumor necrosis factor ligand superfamily member 14 [Electrophorus electricus]